LPPVRRGHGDRREARARSPRRDRHGAEGDVADDLAANLGDEGHRQPTRGPEQTDQPSLQVGREARGVDGMDRRNVAWLLGVNRYHPSRPPGAEQHAQKQPGPHQ
jgi:hypothetical protein